MRTARVLSTRNQREALKEARHSAAESLRERREIRRQHVAARRRGDDDPAPVPRGSLLAMPSSASSASRQTS
jgi:hypothetical protein